MARNTFKEGIPKKYLDLVGTKQDVAGAVFSRKKLEQKTYDVIDIRWGSAQIMDMTTMEIKHPTFELLLKTKGMKRSQWSKPFPIREITLKKEEI
jgi:hypothetical protein